MAVWDQRLRYLFSLAFASQAFREPVLPNSHPTSLDAQPTVRSAYPTASPLRSKRKLGGIGISTDLSSTTPFGLALDPDLPWADEPSPGNLRFSAGRILTCLFAYLYRHSHFLTLQHSLRYAFYALRTLPYHIGSLSSEIRCQN